MWSELLNSHQDCNLIMDVGLLGWLSGCAENMTVWGFSVEVEFDMRKRPSRYCIFLNIHHLLFNSLIG